MSVVNLRDIKLRRAIGGLSECAEELAKNLQQTREHCAQLEAIMRDMRVNMRRSSLRTVKPEQSSDNPHHSPEYYLPSERTSSEQ